MKLVLHNVWAWMQDRSRLVRCFMLAAIFHAGLVVVIGSIKIVAYLPRVIAAFEDVPLRPSDSEPDDSRAAYREFEYNGPSLGDGGGIGKGPGGITSAGGGTPQSFQASIITSTANVETPGGVGEVLGIFDNSTGARAKATVTAGLKGMGLGDKPLGTGGVHGPGGMLSGRVGPKRSINLHKFGGTEATERAVVHGLRWLKSNQRPDGGWSCSRGDHAASALAVLCFLGHGETPDGSQEFGLTVSSGLQFLVNGIDGEGHVAGETMYSQGLVALALSEGYAMTKSPLVKEPAERTVNAIVRAQTTLKKNPAHVGGWRYAANSDDSDVSVTCWQVMALKSAKNAGLTVPQEAFERTAGFLWRMHGGRGFGYEAPGDSPALTGAAVLCLQFMGYGADARTKGALDFLREQQVHWESSDGAWLLYGWYYITQAMFQSGGKNWDYWNGQIRDTVVRHQQQDGHWDVPAKSSGEKSAVPDAIYATTLSILTLEVYYRYLPLYQLMENP